MAWYTSMGYLPWHELHTRSACMPQLTCLLSMPGHRHGSIDTDRCSQTDLMCRTVHGP